MAKKKRQEEVGLQKQKKAKLKGKKNAKKVDKSKLLSMRPSQVDLDAESDEDRKRILTPKIIESKMEKYHSS